MDLRAIFLAGVEMPELAQRQAFIAEACGANTALREQVESLFRAHDQRSDAAPPPPPPPFATPRELGRLGPFRLLEVLGKGGMGMVYLAEDETLGRKVAVKVLLPMIAISPSAHDRFLREAKAAAALDSDHVVPIYQVGQDNGIPYLVMPFLKGQSLDRWLGEGRECDLTQALRIGQEVARGLAAAHAKGFIHRDIKPGNIWLEACTGRARILDFGLARAMEGAASVTQSGLVVGTPGYLAPEQADGGKVDERSDLFSLGAVLYRLATGQLPFQGESPAALLTSVVLLSPRPVKELKPSLPQDLADLIMEMLAKNPADRPGSAREVLERLRAIELGDPTENAAVADPDNLDTAPAGKWIARRTPPPLPPARSKPARRWRRFAVAALVVLSLTVCGLALPKANRPAAQAEAAAVPPPANAKRFTNRLGMEFVLVPKGKFWMGGRGGRPFDAEVEFAEDFYLGTYEVTNEEWEKVMGGPNPHAHFSRAGKNWEDVKNVPEADLCRFPVDTVNLEDCLAFLVRLNEKAAEEGWVYRLPRKAEWEYACRGGPGQSKEAYGFDFYLERPTNTLLPERANFSESGLKRPCKVGSYPPNRLGLHDMHGNVFEVCEDALLDENGGPLMPLMGGGYCDPADFCRVTNRGIGAPQGRFNGSGLRVARVRRE